MIDLSLDNAITIRNFKTNKSFTCEYDAVAGPTSSQADVYDIVRQCTSSVISGTNSTILAYGQTGSGKVVYYIMRDSV